MFFVHLGRAFLDEAADDAGVVLRYFDGFRGAAGGDHFHAAVDLLELVVDLLVVLDQFGEGGVPATDHAPGAEALAHFPHVLLQRPGDFRVVGNGARLVTGGGQFDRAPDLRVVVKKGVDGLLETTRAATAVTTAATGAAAAATGTLAGQWKRQGKTEQGGEDKESGGFHERGGAG